MANTTFNQQGKKVKIYIPSNDSDYDNPQYLYSNVVSELLCAIVNGEIDAKELAKKELENRGLNNKGVWVGFKK